LRQPIDLILITTDLRSSGILEKIGGPAYLTETHTFVLSPANIDYYIEGLIEHNGRRCAEQICSKALVELKGGDTAAIARAASELATIPIGRPDSTAKRTFHSSILEKAQRIENGDPDADTTKTGLTFLDEH